MDGWMGGLVIVQQLGSLLYGRIGSRNRRRKRSGFLRVLLGSFCCFVAFVAAAASVCAFVGQCVLKLPGCFEGFYLYFLVLAF